MEIKMHHIKVDIFENIIIFIIIINRNPTNKLTAIN